MPDTRDSVRRFTKALCQAIYDKRIETENEIIYYYDADVVVRMTLGFMDSSPETKEKDQRIQLVRTLLSSGYLGTAQILRPHAFEFSNKIKTLPNFDDKNGRQIFKQHMTNFLIERGVQDDFNRLRSIIQKYKGTERFLNELQSCAIDTFLAIEHANGNWQQRLLRFSNTGVLIFDRMGESVSTILNSQTEFLWNYHKLIQEERKVDRQSIINDSAAMEILRRLINSRMEDKKTPLVRFYTETTALNKMWVKSQELKGSLCYNHQPGTHDQDFIFRNEDYFVIRAVFEELSFKNLTKNHIKPAVSLETLEKVYKELNSVLEYEDTDLIHFMNTKEVGQKKLSGYLDSFTNLSFINTIWTQYKIPKAMASSISGLTEVLSFVEENTIGVTLRKSIMERISVIQRKIEDGVNEYDQWHQCLKQIQASSKNYLADYDDSEVPDPFIDLGLLRWGIVLPDRELNILKERLNNLLSKDYQKWYQECVTISYNVANNTENADNCFIVCALLWLINEYELIVKLTADLISRNPDHPLSLHIMNNAASLNAKKLKKSDKETLCSELQKRFDNLEQPERKKYYIGIAYVYLHCWLSGGKKIDEKHWATKSITVVKDGLGHLEQNDPLWIFALNHIVYASTTADIASEETHSYIVLLIGSIASPYWNYRFNDTIGYYYIKRAQPLFHDLGKCSPEEKSQKLDAIKKYIERAHSYYKNFKPFGDKEAQGHLDELKFFEAEIAGISTKEQATRPYFLN